MNVKNNDEVFVAFGHTNWDAMAGDSIKMKRMFMIGYCFPEGSNCDELNSSVMPTEFVLFHSPAENSNLGLGLADVYVAFLLVSNLELALPIRK